MALKQIILQIGLQSVEKRMLIQHCDENGVDSQEIILYEQMSDEQKLAFDNVEIIGSTPPQ